MYWITSASFGLVQTLTLRSPEMRAILGLPAGASLDAGGNATASKIAARARRPQEAAERAAARAEKRREDVQND